MPFSSHKFCESFFISGLDFLFADSYNSSNAQILYRAVETAPAGYTVSAGSVAGTAAAGYTQTLANTYAYTTITVSDVSTGTPRPAATKITLSNASGPVETCTLSAANGWTYTFTGLPTVDSGGNAAAYTVSQSTVANYTTVGGALGGTAAVGYTASFTNTYTPPASNNSDTGSASSGSGSVSAVTVPVTGDTTVNVTASVSGDTAKVAVTDSKLQRALGSGESVVVDASSLKTDAAEIPASAVKTVAADADASLTVKTGSGSVTLDSATLAQTAALGGNITVSVQKAASSSLTDTQKALVGDRPVYDLKLTAGTKTVSSFDGSVTVSVPYTLKTGERADAVTVWYLSDSGALTPVSGVYDAKTGTVSFKTTHFSAYVVGYFPFTDVPASHWAYGDIAWAYTNGLLTGTSDTAFTPEQTMTRAMLVTVLWRAAGSPTVDYAMNFSDVPEGEWYSEAVRWAASEKLVNGFGDGSFRTDGTVTREQLAAILYRSELRKGGGFTGDWAFRLDYSDADSVSDWANEAMCWCAMKGIVTGSDGALLPQSGATRAQAAAMLRRYSALKQA